MAELQNPLLSLRGYGERWDDADYINPISTLGYGELTEALAVPHSPSPMDMSPARPGRGLRSTRGN